MSYESNLSNIILRMKEAKANRPSISLQKIADQTGVSIATVTRIFSEGSENRFFRPESIQPIASMLLGLDDLDEGNDDEKALKAIIKFKESEIADLKDEMRVMSNSYETKIKMIEKKHEETISHYRKQLSLKDDAIDRIMKRLENQDDMFEYMTQQYFNAIADLTKKIGGGQEK